MRTLHTRVGTVILFLAAVALAVAFAAPAGASTIFVSADTGVSQSIFAYEYVTNSFPGSTSAFGGAPDAMTTTGGKLIVGQTNNVWALDFDGATFTGALASAGFGTPGVKALAPGPGNIVFVSADTGASQSIFAFDFVANSFPGSTSAFGGAPDEMTTTAGGKLIVAKANNIWALDFDGTNFTGALASAGFGTPGIKALAPGPGNVVFVSADTGASQSIFAYDFVTNSFPGSTSAFGGAPDAMTTTADGKLIVGKANNLWALDFDGANFTGALASAGFGAPGIEALAAAAVPEPTTLTLLGLGALALAPLARRRRKEEGRRCMR